MIFRKYLSVSFLKIAVLITGIFQLFIIPVYSQEKNMTTIGIAKWIENTEHNKNIQGFKDALNEAGYVEGQNVKYITILSEADFNTHLEKIEFLVDYPVDLIYSLTTPGTLAAKSVTKNIPIVFSIVTYPVESGVIKSLTDSGNNLVGTRNYVSPARQYYFFEMLYPRVKSIGFVHRKGESNSAIQYGEFKKLLSKRQISVVDIAAVNLTDMRDQLESNIERLDALYSACDTLIQSGGEDIVIDISRKFKKPSFSCLIDGVEKGALMGNVTDFYKIGRLSGEKAVLILQGTQASRILTESTAEDHIVLNRKTAIDLDIPIPKKFLDAVRRVVE